MPQQDSTVYYPRVRDLLAKVSATRPLSNKELAKAICKSLTLVSYIRNGVRPPSEADIDAIAGAFYPRPTKDPRQKGMQKDDLTKDREAFCEELKAAVKDKQEIPRGDTLKSLIKGVSKITPSSADCFPISGDTSCMFEELFIRLLDLCGLSYKQPENRLYFEADSITDTTVLLSVFDSIERMLRLKFFRFPLRMSLNFIADCRHQAKGDKIARIMSYSHSQSDLLVRPIVLHNSVGATHCSKRLKALGSKIVTVTVKPGDQSAEQLAKQLIEETKSNRPGIPVVCADELLCFKVLNILRSLGHPGFSVLPMISRRAVEDTGARRETPLCYISAAVKRENRDFMEYMQDALIQLLSTEIQTTSNVWFKLAQKLLHDMIDFNPAKQKFADEMEEARRWRTAWEWIQFTLHLDTDSINTYTDPAGLPWKPILYRTRRLMHEYLASPECEEILRSQMALAQDENQGSLIDEYVKLRELFDLPLDGPATSPVNREDLENQLRLALLGHVRKLDVSIREFDTASDAAHPDMLATRRLLRNLQGLYELNNRPETVARIEEEIDELATLYSGSKGKIILASVNDSSANVIGILCVRASEHHAREAELRFLFVDSKYRRFGMGEKLLKRGIEAAKALGCDSAFAEILPDMREATRLSTRSGFEEDTTAEPRFSGRQVFRLKLTI